MARLVHLRPSAYADIREIAAYIARRVSPMSAARWQAVIDSAIARLADECERWPEAAEAVVFGSDLREMLHGRRRHVYRILFTFDNEMVNVHRVRHAAQDNLSAEDL